MIPKAIACFGIQMPDADRTAYLASGLSAEDYQAANHPQLAIVQWGVDTDQLFMLVSNVAQTDRDSMLVINPRQATNDMIGLFTDYAEDPKWYLLCHAD